MGFANFDEALGWYIKGRFTAEDVTRASGISEAAQRDLQKRKIFSPVPQKHTAKRMLFGDTVMRLCIAGAVNECGIPLLPASRIVHADVFMGDFLIPSVDPFQIFFDGFEEEKQNYKRKGDPDPDGLYDPRKPVVQHKTDDLIEIVNSRYVKITHGPFRSDPQKANCGWILGELTKDKADFIVWHTGTFQHIIAGKKPHQTLIDDSGLWAAPNKMPTAAEERKAAFACANPISKVTVNAGMALRAGLRRLLHIDPPKSQDAV